MQDFILKLTTKNWQNIGRGEALFASRVHVTDATTSRNPLTIPALLVLEQEENDNGHFLTCIYNFPFQILGHLDKTSMAANFFNNKARAAAAAAAAASSKSKLGADKEDTLKLQPWVEK